MTYSDNEILNRGIALMATSKSESVEKTRPANTTPYTIGDAIAESDSAGTPWSFEVGRIETGSGIIVGATISTDQSANTAQFELDLYRAALTGVNDNAEAARLYALQAFYLDTIQFPAAAKKTTNSTQAEATISGINIPFKCAANSLIYGILRTATAFTPASGQKFRITLHVLQD